MLYNTYLHVMRTGDMYFYVWGSIPSYVPLVAFLTGKCLLVLLLPNTWIYQHVSFFAPISIPLGKCQAMFTIVLVALL